MQNNNWKTLKKDYENLSTKPSADVWEKLNENLNKKEKKPAIKFNFLRIAAIFLFFAMLSVVFYYYQKTESLNNNLISKTDIKKNLPAKNTTDFGKVKEEKNPESKKPIIYSEKKLTTISVKKEENSTSKLSIEPNNTKIDSGNFNEKLALKPALKVIKEIPTEQKIAEIKYVNADELLFARELNRNNNKETIQKKEKLGVINVDGIKKPKSVTILGFTVYSDSADSN